jgi:hypothetical protein
MKKSKYGERTVVIRVPESRKSQVLDLLKSFEVLDGLQHQSTGLTNFSSSDDYKKGYMKGFEQGEEFQYCLSYGFAGTEDDVKLALDVFRQRIPDSALTPVLNSLSNVLLKSDVDVLDNAFSFFRLLENSR